MTTAPYLAADMLAPSKRNLVSLDAAWAKMTELGYAPRRVDNPEGCTRTRCAGAHNGYPGSEHLWALTCELCGEDVEVYYSHMRRNKRHRGCTFAGKKNAAARAARYAELGLTLPAWDTEAQAEATAATEAETAEQDAAEARVEVVAVEGEARAAEVEVETAPPKGRRAARSSSTSTGAEDADQESDIRRRAGVVAPARRASGPVVVVACGGRKADGPAAAGELYVGSYHRVMRRAADALTADGGRVLILSGRYGLVSLDEVLAPYEQRIGTPGAVDAATVRAQAEALGVADAAVTILGGRAYVDAAREVWADAEAPLAGSRGIGEQLARLADIYRDAPTTGHVDHIERDVAARKADEAVRETRKRAAYVTASTVRVNHRGRAEVRLDFPRAAGKGVARARAARRIAATYGVEVHTVHKLTHYNPAGRDCPGPVRDELALDVTGAPEDVTRLVSGLPRALDKVETLTTAAVRHYGRWERHSVAVPHLEHLDASGRRAAARRFRAEAFEAVVDALLDPAPVYPELVEGRPAWDQAAAIGETYALYGFVDVDDQADADEVEQLLADADRSTAPAAAAYEAELAELYAAQARRSAALSAALDGDEQQAPAASPIGEVAPADEQLDAAPVKVPAPRPAEIAGPAAPSRRPREDRHHRRAAELRRPARRLPHAYRRPAPGRLGPVRCHYQEGHRTLPREPLSMTTEEQLAELAAVLGTDTVALDDAARLLADYLDQVDPEAIDTDDLAENIAGALERAEL